AAAVLDRDARPGGGRAGAPAGLPQPGRRGRGRGRAAAAARVPGRAAAWRDRRSSRRTGMTGMVEPPGPAPALVQVRDLRVHFPVTRGAVLRRRVGAVRAVDGVSMDILRGETL